jgi:hypothetical protein
VLAVAKAYIFVMQSGMRVVAKQHLSAVAKLMGVTEEQTIKVFTAERKALNVGDEVGVVKKGHEVA